MSALGRSLFTARRGPPHPETWRHGPHPAWQRGPAASFGSTVPCSFTSEFSGRVRLAAGFGVPERAPRRAEADALGQGGTQRGEPSRPALADQRVYFISDLPVFTRNERGLRILLSGRALGGGR